MTSREEYHYILCAVYGKPLYEIYLSKTLDKRKMRKVCRILNERKKGIPLQYLCKKAYFLDLELEIERGVFIPRPETEGVVILSEKLFLEKKPNYILDIGTGTGALAIALARLFKEAKIIATDISKRALKVARINLKKYKLQDRVKLYYADLFYFRGFSRYYNTFDLIVSNPPYVPKDKICKLPPLIKDYEPYCALNGGQDGFQIIERIIKEGMRFLAFGGKMVLEIDPRHKEKILSLVKEGLKNPLTIEFAKDLSQKVRYALVSRGLI